MNATSGSPADENATSPAQRVLVWDAPVRVFHWLIVLSFAGAWLTAEGERWRLVHLTLGYTMAGLVAFRIVWGLIGTRHARFASFVRAPAAVLRYFGSILRGKPEHHVGHNPAGALAIVGLLLLAAGVAATGWAMDNSLAAGWLEEVHEGVANAMLALVAVHIAAVVFSSWLHRENLVAAMISGRKRGQPRDAIRSRWRSVAGLVLVAVLGFWWLQWQDAPAGQGPVAGAQQPWGKMANHDDDD